MAGPELRRQVITNSQSVMNADRIIEHARGAVSGAKMHESPLPHILVENFLPGDFYQLLEHTIPDSGEFVNRDHARGDIEFVRNSEVPAHMDPWLFLLRPPLADALASICMEKFSSVIEKAYYGPNFGEFASEARSLPQKLQLGRLMLRRAGYHLPPHRDPKSHALTGLLYMSSGGGLERYGTQLFECDRDFVSPISLTFRVNTAGIGTKLVKTIPYVPNSLLVFANTGAHGSEIPLNVPDKTAERYSLQFYVGPERSEIDRIVQKLPPELRASWETKTLSAKKKKTRDFSVEGQWGGGSM